MTFNAYDPDATAETDWVRPDDYPKPAAAEFDAAAIVDYLVGVHHHPGDLSLMALPPRGQKGGPRFARFTDADAAVDWAENRDRAGSAGIYLRTTNVTGPQFEGRGDVTVSASLGYLWADLDYGVEGHKTGTSTAKRAGLPLPPTEAEVLRLIDHLPEPTALVHSGGGLYPLWLLDEPIDLTTEGARAEATALSAGWQKMIKHRADELGYEYGAGVGDLPRVLRLPGTVNRKTEQGRPCYLVRDNGPRHGALELRAILSAWEAEREREKAAAEEERRAQKRVDRIDPGWAQVRAEREHRDSVLDVLAAHTSWADLLEPEGWTQIPAPDSHTAEAWQRPGADTVSAKVLHENPHVLVVWSESAGVPSGAGQKLTKGRLWTALHYADDPEIVTTDDLARAARALETLTGPGTDSLPDACRDALRAFSKNRPALSNNSTDEDSAAGQWTENALSERAAHEALTDYSWTAAAGWLRWTGVYWDSECTDAEVQGAVRQWARGVLRDVLGKESSAPAEVQKAARIALGTGKGLNAIMSLTRSQRLADFAKFDNDPDILVCPNGVLDLRTGELMPHSRDRLVTKCTGVDYVPGARSADWDTALTAMRPDAVDWMKSKWGQGITGHAADGDVMPVLHGGGSNGKTSILGPINAALGTYSDTVSDSLLLAENSAHPTDFMDLKGLRFAYVEELPDRHLNTTRLKKLVGTEYLKARRMRADFVSFKVTHSLVVTSNHKPGIDDSDAGTWRRLALVSFPYRYVPEGEPLEGENDRRGDYRLRERVKSTEALQACLAWLVEGARAWYARGQSPLPVPASVKADTTEWRHETDAVLSYATDHLVPARGHVIPTRVMLSHFNAWLEDSRGQRSWSDRTLNARLGGHSWTAAGGITVQRARHREEGWRLADGTPYAARAAFPAWVGVRFRTAADDMEDLATAAAHAEAPESPAEAQVAPAATVTPIGAQKAAQRPAAVHTPAVARAAAGEGSSPAVRLSPYQSGAAIQADDF